MENYYWYFVAQIETKNWIITYDGYVAHRNEFFPVNTAKLQTVDCAGISPEDVPTEANGDKKFFLKNTFIINQTKVPEAEFEAWKITKKF